MNARVEFIEHVQSRIVKCAQIQIFTTQSKYKIINLRIGYTGKDYAAFLTAINVDYDHRNEMQNLFGFIWYADGSWSFRAEYKGVEWWNYAVVPEIPKVLK